MFEEKTCLSNLEPYLPVLSHIQYINLGVESIGIQPRN